MEEAHAILGILLISAVALTSYFVITGGGAGAVTSDPYIACCCNIIHTEGYAQQAEQTLVRSQIQTFAFNCEAACTRYSEFGDVFAQDGLCAENP